MAKHKLKLVHSVDERRHRNIVGTIHRSSQRSEDRSRNLTRRYSSPDAAIAGLTRFMYQYGYVGDVCEVYHYVTGLQIGTMKMTSKGKLITNWIWDRE